jgi:wyosine [tRNA(Phe)-imidazoG37] synthetase (radical SAM superfamily)
VYPVISRRSRGLSVGIDLNVDGACNFDCIYCQVDRRALTAAAPVDIDQLRWDLDEMIQVVTSGSIWDSPRFAATPLALRAFADIAFSGDGEPTASPAFARACDVAIDLRRKHTLTSTKLVVITNATRLHRPEVRAAIEALTGHGGEIWAKLDAGTQDYFQQIERPRAGITLDRITAHITDQARRHPVVIQTMVLAIDGKPIDEDEFSAYLQRLAMILDGGGRIARVQLYTVARDPAQPGVTPLNSAQIDALADRLRDRLPNLACQTFYAPD